MRDQRPERHAVRAVASAARGLLALTWLGVALLSSTPRASADGAQEISALRAQLAALQAEQGNALPEGAFLSIAYTLDVAERIERGFASQAALWRARATRLMETARAGRDPFPEQAGKLLMRGYRSPLSLDLQGYGIYLPPGYDPSRAYPLVVVLHGGSANGNLFLAVVLGNNMNWKEYSQHLWDEYLPRYTPDCIVVAPDGFGQVMWRFMGEQDVLDVIEDVQRHYRVDEDRVTLAGLSNGGVGAYNLGLRHAWRFNVVQAIAGAPSWLQYAGGKIDPIEQRTMAAQSGMQLAENAIDTAFQYHHGRTDPGPMKPRFVEEFGKHIASLGVPFKERWYDAGHDLLYIAQRHASRFTAILPAL
jgi:predicted esterase